MAKPPILDPAASYSFSQYAALPFDTADVLGEFGVAFQSHIPSASRTTAPRPHPIGQ